MTEIQRLAEYVIEKLKVAGLILQRYDAYSSNSVYLKLDYGVCNSIRISDHKSKKHLHYRYNLLSTLKQASSYRVRPQGWIRNQYPFDAVDKMIADIIRDRNRKIAAYGKSKYRKYMMQNLLENGENRGFWAQCVEV